jgi:hypothetical protein
MFDESFLKNCGVHGERNTMSAVKGYVGLANNCVTMIEY